MSAVFHCVYLAWKHPRRRIEVTFPVSRPAFITKTAFCVVKETEKLDELHVDFARQCGKSPVTTSAVLHCVYLAWMHPRRRIEVTFQVSRPAFFTTNTASRTVKETEKHNESHADFTRQTVW